MPDVLESLMIDQAHQVAQDVLQCLREAGEPVGYAAYVRGMEAFGFDRNLAKDAFVKLGCGVTPDMKVVFP